MVIQLTHLETLLGYRHSQKVRKLLPFAFMPLKERGAHAHLATAALGDRGRGLRDGQCGPSPKPWSGLPSPGQTGTFSLGASPALGHRVSWEGPGGADLNHYILELRVTLGRDIVFLDEKRVCFLH